MLAEQDPGGLQPGDTIALTGATGFLGRYVQDFLTQAGYKIRSLTRARRENTPNIDWVTGDLDNQFALFKLVDGASALIHVAGLVAAKKRRDFLTVNVGGTARLALTAALSKPCVRRALYISSITAREPHLSAYARSKRAAEAIWRGLPPPIESMIIRPPAIYGPGDPHVKSMIDTAGKGWLPNLGGRGSRFSLIHVEDTARAIVHALTQTPVPEQPVEISDSKTDGYSMGEVADIIGHATGQKVQVRTLPRWLVRSAGIMNEAVNTLMSRQGFFNAGKAWEVTHPDWVAAPPANAALSGWTPQLDFEMGLKTVLQQET